LSRSLYLFDILTPRSLLGCGWLALTSIRAWFGFESITAQTDWLDTYLFDYVFGVFRIRDKSITVHASILFTNQPFNGGPGAASTFAGYSLNMSLLPYILSPKGNKTCLWKNFHVIVIAFSAVTGFLSLLSCHWVASFL
jgi:hypothetical protein